MVVVGRCGLICVVTSRIRFSVAPMEVHLYISNNLFVYLNKYLRRGYAINPQPLTIDMEYENVELKMDFGNQYS